MDLRPDGLGWGLLFDVVAEDGRTWTWKTRERLGELLHLERLQPLYVQPGEPMRSPERPAEQAPDESGLSWLQTR